MIYATDTVSDYGDVLDLQMFTLRQEGKMNTTEYSKLWLEKYFFDKAQREEAWAEGQNDYSCAEEV